MKKDQCKGFRKHNWIRRLATSAQGKLDRMAAFYLNWVEMEDFCTNCRKSRI